ncbi:MAG: hypothetical protein GY795_27760 [Desulfobacterales bacterium]|nr:hypothetical protein [Desulfobacterales bacterium]
MSVDRTSYTGHFLDTSVARPLILGSNRYKRFFKECFGSEALYISEYVRMEFMRSWVSSVLDFYFLLDMPGVETIGDAFSIWSNQFRTSRQKAVNQLAAQIFDTHAFNLTNPGDKEKALRAIARVVDRILLKWKHKFKMISENSIQCQRAMVLLKYEHGSSYRQRFERFQICFNDVKECRSKCHVDKFFLDRYKSEVENCLKYASCLSNPTKKENRGFIRIVKELKRVADGKRDFSCHLCEAIGDVVIALESPLNMRLEHTDHSFDHLCNLIDKPHCKHPSEITVVC